MIDTGLKMKSMKLKYWHHNQRYLNNLSTKSASTAETPSSSYNKTFPLVDADFIVETPSNGGRTALADFSWKWRRRRVTGIT